MHHKPPPIAWAVSAVRAVDARLRRSARSSRKPLVSGASVPYGTRDVGEADAGCANTPMVGRRTEGHC
jgi:hypothetical protein